MPYFGLSKGVTVTEEDNNRADLLNILSSIVSSEPAFLFLIER